MRSARRAINRDSLVSMSRNGPLSGLKDAASAMPVNAPLRTKRCSSPSVVMATTKSDPALTLWYLLLAGYTPTGASGVTPVGMTKSRERLGRIPTKKSDPTAASHHVNNCIVVMDDPCRMPGGGLPITVINPDARRAIPKLEFATIETIGSETAPVAPRKDAPVPAEEPHVTSLPVFETARDVSPTAATTENCSDSVSLISPYEFVPQDLREPFESTAVVKVSPACTETTPERPAGMSHCPYVLSPQHTTVPSVLSAALWFAVDETWTTPDSPAGTPDTCPALSAPQHTTVPPERRATTWLRPAATSTMSVNSTPRIRTACREVLLLGTPALMGEPDAFVPKHLPNMFHPQANTLRTFPGSSVVATLNLSPALIETTEESPDGTVDCELELRPQQTTVPSVFNAIVWLTPELTA